MRLANILLAYAAAIDSKILKEGLFAQRYGIQLSEQPARPEILPIKRVDRLVQRLAEWAETWIGSDNGKIGFYEKPLKFGRRLRQVQRTFKRNIVRCNPHLLPDDSELTVEQESRSAACMDVVNQPKTCAFIEAFDKVRRLERLQRDYITCPQSKAGDRREGIDRRMQKLRHIIVNSVCQAHAASLDQLYDSQNSLSIQDCKQLANDNDFDIFYDEVIQYLSD